MPSISVPAASDPLAPPSSTSWRRNRLLSIGSNATSPDDDVGDVENEDSPLLTRPLTEYSPLQETPTSQTYGTLASSIDENRFSRRSLANFKGASRPTSIPLYRSLTNPGAQNSGFRDLASRLNAQRPISAYDAALRTKGDSEQDADARINGIRVWYSSYSSIDWLHDAIKDSVRFAKLRRRKSVRARIRLFVDKSLGWVIVTIVGILTAIVAFLVVRSEQWLFDLKDGYCGHSWWLPMRFCCPVLDDAFRSSALEACSEWRTWEEVFSYSSDEPLSEVIRYVAYTILSVRPSSLLIGHASAQKFLPQIIFALTSCFLTIRLTKSSTFVTRKESGVLSPYFQDSKEQEGQSTRARRSIMYYVGGAYENVQLSNLTVL